MNKYDKLVYLMLFFLVFFFIITMIFLALGQIQTIFAQIFGILFLIFLFLYIPLKYFVQWWKSHDTKKKLEASIPIYEQKLKKMEVKGKVILKSDPKLKLTKKAILGLLLLSLLILFFIISGILFTINGIDKIIYDKEIIEGIFRLFLGVPFLISGVFIIVMTISMTFSYVIIHENGILHRNPNYFTFLLKRFIPFIQFNNVEIISETRSRGRYGTRKIDVLYITTTFGKTYKIPQDYVPDLNTVHNLILKKLEPKL